MLRYIISHNDIKRERIKTFCGVLRNVFRYARRYQYIDSNPTEEIDFKRIYRQCEQNVKIDEEETLTDEELAKLLSVIHMSEYEKPEYLPNYAVELIALTGMRAGEVIALEISDIDNKKQVIHISKSIHRNDFKYKPCEYVIGPTKTGKDRTFPITDDVKELLGRIDRIRNEYGIDSERLFGPISGNQLTHTMSRRCKRAGIDSKSTHDLRRTLSSNLAKSGMSIGTIALLLGHLPETNKRFYQYDTTSHSEKCAILSSLWQRIDNAEIG
jgi:integrase